MEILDKPPVNVPERKTMPILENTLTAEVRDLDTKYFNQVGKFREDTEKLCQELDSKGEGSMYSQLQPWIGLSWLIYWNGVLTFLVNFW